MASAPPASPALTHVPPQLHPCVRVRHELVAVRARHSRTTHYRACAARAHTTEQGGCVCVCVCVRACVCVCVCVCVC